MSSQSILNRLGGGALGTEWQMLPSNGAGRRRLTRQWAWGRRCDGTPPPHWLGCVGGGPGGAAMLDGRGPVAVGH